MKYISRLLLAALLLPVFTSCEVEFSPNADWKNVPVVYCVLDQDDDTSWVRVERCHLSNDGVYAYGQVRDSIFYGENEITVDILGYEGNTLRDSIPFAYMERQRDSGAFAGGLVPIYYAETQERLKSNYDYYLHVRAADGRILASSNALRLIDYNPENKLFHQLKNNKFGFYDISGTSSANCLIKWDVLPRGRVYQPMIRFYYRVASETRYVDVRCPRVVPDHNASTGSLTYPRATFLNDLKAKLILDTSSRKEYLKMVDIYLTCCDEDLNTFMSTTSGASVIDQGRVVYSNINGGVGIFAARRTHLYRRFNADDSDVSNSGLGWFLKDLGVGIYIP